MSPSQEGDTQYINFLIAGKDLFSSDERLEFTKSEFLKYFNVMETIVSDYNESIEQFNSTTLPVKINQQILDQRNDNINKKNIIKKLDPFG